jgi:hypothetical protein
LLYLIPIHGRTRDKPAWGHPNKHIQSDTWGMGGIVLMKKISLR